MREATPPETRREFTTLDVVLTAVIGLSVAYMAFGNGRVRENWQVIKTYRLWHFISNTFVIGIVLVTALWLIENVPFFDQNPILWIVSEIFGIGDGKGGANILFSGTRWKWYALIYLPLLMFALPALAKSEEETYRAGTKDWAQGLVRSIRFGLVHLIMLIPLGAAVALSIGGLWFTHQYFKGGIERSTTYHAVYNSMLFAVLFALIFFS